MGTKTILAGVAALGLVAAGCATGSNDGGSSIPATARSSSVITTTPTAGIATTTTGPTTTTVPQTPSEIRAATVEYVEGEGWVKYEDETGWSIWYPGDWTVAFSDDGSLGLVTQGTSDFRHGLAAAVTDSSRLGDQVSNRGCG